jgi:hypothetical protein
VTPARWPYAHLEHGIRASTPDCLLQVAGRASSVLVDLRGSRQGPPQSFSPARRASNSPSPRLVVTVGLAAVGHAGAARTCRSCRSSVCHLYLIVCVCVCWAVGEGLSLCWYVKVTVTCLHSRAPQAHLLVACWCSQRGLHRTVRHPAAVMIASVLPGRPRAFCGRITHCCHLYQAVLTCVCVHDHQAGERRDPARFAPAYYLCVLLSVVLSALRGRSACWLCHTAQSLLTSPSW